MIHSFSVANWAVIFILLNFAMALSITSTTVAAILLGYFLGWPSFAVYVLVYLTATVTGNLIARGIDKGKFLNSLKEIKSIDRYLGAIENDQLPLIIIARISPIFPFSVMNVFLAAAGFKLDKILLGSLVGMLPRTVVAFWIGSQFAQLKSLMDEGLRSNIFDITALVLITVSLAGLYFYINKILKKAAGKYL